MSLSACECGLTAWKATGLNVILVDAVDARSDDVRCRNWWPDGKPAKRVKGTRRHGDPSNVLLHRMIMKAATGQIVDHINGNPLDNRRCNLRFATSGQNSMNSRPKRLGLKGVHIHSSGRWRAQIWANGTRHDLGLHNTEDDAHAAYVAAAQKLHGDFFAERVVSSPCKLNAVKSRQ